MEKKKKRRFGDRKDGRLLRTLDPYHGLMPFIMKTRNDACNYFSDSIEISEADRFLRSKRTGGYPGMGVLHLFTAAYVRVASQYPGINRFIAGQRVYSRDIVELVMSIKLEMKAEAPETSIKVVFEPSDTIYDIYNKLSTEIEKVKKDGEATDTDDIAKILAKIPRLFLKFAVFFLDLLDYFGKLPQSIIKASPFHGSVIITDIGSIGLPPIYHHIYNFGNLPTFIAIGAKRKARELQMDGSVVERKYIDYTLVLDERINDGFYFSQVYKLFKSLLRNPELLEAPPETVVEDVE